MKESNALIGGVYLLNSYISQLSCGEKPVPNLSDL